MRRALPLLVPVLLLAAAASLAPASRAECQVSLGSCDGSCDVNVGACGTWGSCKVNLRTCNYGDCAVNVSYCGASCTVSSGAVGASMVSSGGCQHDCAVNVGNVCGVTCPSGDAWVGIAVVPLHRSLGWLIVCAPLDASALPYACTPDRCYQP